MTGPNNMNRPVMLVFFLFLLSAVSTTDAILLHLVEQQRRSSVQDPAEYIQRTRISLANDIFRQLGPRNVRRAYRMSEESFFGLLHMLRADLERPHFVEYTASNGQRKRRRVGAKNGVIPSCLRLSAAIRFFAGGSVYDIALVHGISIVEVYESVWMVVNGVNSCDRLKISFPTSHLEQERLAAGFFAQSAAGFDNVVAAIDGLLIWTEKPSSLSCDSAGFGPAKFFCGRKHKYGLNLMGTVDFKGRFLDVSIGHPASTSDYLAFANSLLRQKLDQDLLQPGLIILGDNAYVNSKYMATPFRSARNTEDDYNFYHSQLRIKVECAFGMLVHRWGILRRPIASAISISRVSKLVICLCRLHNFCLDVNEEAAPQPSIQDEMVRLLNGGVPLENQGTNPLSPEELLHGGDGPNSAAEMQARNREERANRYALEDGSFPRNDLHDIVVSKGLRRPTVRN